MRNHRHRQVLVFFATLNFRAPTNMSVSRLASLFHSHHLSSHCYNTSKTLAPLRCRHSTAFVSSWITVPQKSAVTPGLRTLSTSPPTGRLQGKTAIITGASSGIGRVIALQYSAEGANIVCADIRETTKYDKSDVETRGTTHERVNENGGKAIFVSTDVTNAIGMENVVERAVEAFGRLDVMVNNAGVALESANPGIPVWDVPVEMWEKTQSINSTGPFLGTKVSPHKTPIFRT